MSRKKKKKSPVMSAAGLAARVLLRKRIVKKEQDRAFAQAQGGRRGRLAKVKIPAADAALYHALGGRASKEALQEKGRQKALKKAVAASTPEKDQKKALKKAAAVSAAVVVHKRKHRLVRRLLGAPVLLLGRALIKKKKG